MREHDQQKLGEYLRHERISRGISIDHIAEKTRIRSSIIEALEADRYDQLPPKAFFRGYIISYCQCIGIDPKNVITRYRDTLSKPPVKRLQVDELLGGYTYERTRKSWSLWAIVVVTLLTIAACAVVIVTIYQPSLITSLLSVLFESDPEEEISSSPTEIDRVVSISESQESRAKAVPDNQQSISSQRMRDGTPEGQMTPGGSSATDPSMDANAADTQPAGAMESETAPPLRLSVEPYRKPTESDNLNKGDSLPAARIFFKVVLRARRDVWLRYQVDGLPRSDYRLLTGRIMVLRAEQRILLLFQDQSAVEVRFDADASYRNLKQDDFQSLSGFAALAHPRTTWSELAIVFSDTHDFPPQ